MRITPAGAGKTGQLLKHFRNLSDHPRGCGENRYVPDRRQRGIGSPPRMRGKLPCISDQPPIIRITPADAGKTTSGALISEPL